MPAFTTPTAPATFDTSLDASYYTGTQHVCTTAAELTTALAACVDTDQILLAPGVTFSGQFTLRNRGTSGSVWIRTNLTVAALDAVCPAGTRMTPAKAAALNLATLETTLSNGGLVSAFGASGYRITAVKGAIASALAGSTGLWRLGNAALTQDSQACSDMLVDRCVVVGDMAKDVSRGIQLCGPRTGVVDSWIGPFHHSGTDAQAVAAFCYKGPYHVENCYLYGWGQSFMIGGAWWGAAGYGTISCSAGAVTFTQSQDGALVNGDTVTVAGTTYTVSGFDGDADPTHCTLSGSPTFGASAFYINGDPTNVNSAASDLTFRRNYCTRVEADYTPSLIGKVGFEIKSCHRALIEQNIIDHVPRLQQDGYINFKNAGNEVDGCDDIHFRDNWIRYAACGMALNAQAMTGEALGNPVNPAILTNRILVEGNLFEHLNDTAPWVESDPDSEGVALRLAGPLADATVRHNTWVKVTNTGKPSVLLDQADGVAVGPVAVQNNLLVAGTYGVKENGVAIGQASWDDYTNGLGLWEQNVLAGTTDATMGPTGTLVAATDSAVGYTDLAGGNYALSVGSPYKGQASDGADIGIVDVASFLANLATVETGDPTGAIATQLLLSQQPVGFVSGVAHSTAPAGTVANASNVTVTSDTSTVTASLVVESGSATPIGTLTATVVGGAWTFAGKGLGATGVGARCHWHFADGSLTGVDSTSFTIVDPAALLPFRSHRRAIL